LGSQCLQRCSPARTILLNKKTRRRSSF
jgi:hypothetical protein